MTSQFSPVSSPSADTASAASRPTVLATPRSLRLTLYDGWRMVVLHPKHSMAHLLPSVLCTAAALAYLFHVLSASWPALFVSPHFLGEGSIYADHPEAAFQLSAGRLWPVVTAVTLVLVALAWCKGVLWQTIVAYHREGSTSLKWRQVFGFGPIRMGLRWLAFTLLTSVVSLLLLGIVGGAAWGICRIFDVAIPLWVWPLAFAVLYSVVSWIVTPLRFASLSSDKAGRSVGTWLRMGLRHVGATLLLVLLTAIPLVLVGFIFLLPYLTMIISACTATICALPGEGLGLPPHFAQWCFVMGTASMTFILLCATVQTWVLAHKMAAMTAR